MSTEIDPGATAVWPPTPDSRAEASPGRVRRLLGRAVPALVLALVLGWLFEPWLGVLVVLAAITLTTVGLVWPPAGRTIERILGGISHWVGRALSAVILTIVFVLVFLPVGLLSRLFRRDTLATGVTHPGTTWLERWGWGERRLPDRTYASEQDLLGGRRSGRVGWVVGVVTLLILADLAIGTVLVDPPTEGAPPPVAEGGGPSAIPALAGLDYVPRLFTEQFAAESGQYDALLGWRLEDTDGRYLNIVDGERISRTTTAPGDPVVVWFFGGSAMYGFGQRDNHTLPSEMVRLAEADGVALEAHNFGTPAYVNWQAVSLFSRLLTEREAPDLAVFYDGYNDLSMQFVDGPVTEPSHVLARVQQAQLEAPPPGQHPTTGADVRDWWEDHSATVNLYRRVRDRLDGDEPEVRLTEAEASAVPADVDADVVEGAADDLLRRGRDLASALGEGYGVDVQFWFQPTLYSKGAVDGEAYLLDRAANRNPAWAPVIDGLRGDLPPEVVDLADSLDGYPDPLFWDTVHTNEAGVQVIADAAWPLLREAISS
ncbi:MAG: hypothetical protein ABWZ55_09090, partial [Acidimicrobiales bacterium]